MRFDIIHVRSFSVCFCMRSSALNPPESRSSRCNIKSSFPLTHCVSSHSLVWFQTDQSDALNVLKYIKRQLPKAREISYGRRIELHRDPCYDFVFKRWDYDSNISGMKSEVEWTRLVNVLFLLIRWPWISFSIRFLPCLHTERKTMKVWTVREDKQILIEILLKRSMRNCSLKHTNITKSFIWKLNVIDIWEFS